MGGSHSAFSQFGRTAAPAASTFDRGDAPATSSSAARPVVGSGSSAFRPYAGANAPRQASAGAGAPASSQASSKGHERVPIAGSAADRGKRPMSEGSGIAGPLQLMASHASAEASGSQAGPAPVSKRRGAQPGAMHWTKMPPKIGADGEPIPRKKPGPQPSPRPLQLFGPGRGAKPGSRHWTKMPPKIGPDGTPIPRKAPGPAKGSEHWSVKRQRQLASSGTAGGAEAMPLSTPGRKPGATHWRTMMNMR